MGTLPDDEKRPEQLTDTPHLAEALESDRFRQFLDNVPFAVAVAELTPREHITYANIEFERLSGQSIGEIEGKPWSAISGQTAGVDHGASLGVAVVADDDYIGMFTTGGGIDVDVWSNLILDDSGKPAFRLVAMAKRGHPNQDERDELRRRIRDKDTLLRELQHRVKNNLQMITALIRLESRNLPEGDGGERFERLASRINALGLLYQSLSDDKLDAGVDLGVYISQVASAVLQANAPEGIRLDLKVDTWPVSIDVAMPTGLVINELLTNSLKYAFVGRDGGTITLHSLVDETGCRVIIADDGVGFAEEDRWPKAGKLSELIVRSLRQNAKARIEVASERGKGVRVTIFFDRSNAAPDTA
jgi:two-component sensor histidine kinase